jgi:catechol 2,3-dioxygenase-like lactoylglutathione lyase family enzyme
LAVTGVVRLRQLLLITHNLARLADFYVRAFDCSVQVSDRLSVAATACLTGLRVGARRVLLSLGAQHIELLQLDVPGQPYPPDVAASDLRFQHFAIVVADMPRAYRHLRRSGGGWQSISTAGPQRLPVRSGGVSAFKFRDPEGHPLELLCSAPGPVDVADAAAADAAGEGLAPQQTPLFVGIDHSAISVSDSARSIAFYEHLGLQVSARQVNHGREQQQLDGLPRARVQVIALRPPQQPPHLELLCYQNATRSACAAVGPGDVAATRLVFECDEPGAAPQHLADPDGHRLLVC